jgi:hypothetical protein
MNTYCTLTGPTTLPETESGAMSKLCRLGAIRTLASTRKIVIGLVRTSMLVTRVLATIHSCLANLIAALFCLQTWSLIENPVLACLLSNFSTEVGNNRSESRSLRLAYRSFRMKTQMHPVVPGWPRCCQS